MAKVITVKHMGEFMALYDEKLKQVLLDPNNIGQNDEKMFISKVDKEKIEANSQGIKQLKTSVNNKIEELKNELTPKFETKIDKTFVLDGSNKIKSELLPSFVDDVLEFETKTNFPKTGEGGKIYVAVDTNKSYRWGGSSYVELNSSVALGETSGTAYAGDKGKALSDKVNKLQQELDKKLSNSDIASATKLGAVKISDSSGITIGVDGTLGLKVATREEIEALFNAQ